MSVQFGKWSFDGKPASPGYLEKVQAVLDRYAPDGGGTYRKPGVDILYRAFHSTKESRTEIQPTVRASGAVITWDGRLDNRGKVIRKLRGQLSAETTDASIVAVAYEQLGVRCLAEFIGDWALSIWSPTDRSLILAKDPIGVRHLYYTYDTNQVTWSSLLDPLVLFAEGSFRLNEEYIAGWFSFFPAAHLTPYAGIHSVPPSSFVLLQNGKRTISRYWDFDPDMRILYRSDGEYEEHFREVFFESVRRRLRSDSAVLAELSGGMDSSSIVCVADGVLRNTLVQTPRLDTISYYDDSEPNWNELPYLAKVEEQRGRAGCHIDVSDQDLFNFEVESDVFAATPDSVSRPSEADRQFKACVTSQGNRVVLSGIGGDEVTGGVPTPIPELADLMAKGGFLDLAHKLKVWALNKRKPWFHLLFEAAREFLPTALVGVPKHIRPPAWLHPHFVRDYRTALTGYPARVTLSGPWPSFQENLGTLDVLRRQLECCVLRFDPPYEKRYPYLDRGLLEFTYAIPREQLVRPGQRRSLMRRALTGVVPDEILQRKRKAYVSRGPLVGIDTQWSKCLALTREMRSGALGIVDSLKFLDALEKARHGMETPIVTLMRTFAMEFWLRAIEKQGILSSAMLDQEAQYSVFDAREAPVRRLS